VDKSSADRLALHVRRITGHEVTVEGDEDDFVVVVTVQHPKRPGVGRAQYTLWDDEDWDWLAPRILET
jgi:hypothetical protein